MTGQTRLGAILWLLSAEFLIAQLVAQHAFPGYNAAEMEISLLGVTSCQDTGFRCSPLHLVFNLGAAFNGMLVVLGVWLTRRHWPTSPLTSTALWLLAVGGGVGILLIGGFPLNISREFHVAGAMLALFVPCFGMGLLASLYWSSRQGFALYTAATAVLCLAVLILYAMELYLGLPPGAMERIMAWAHTIWYPTTGALILAGYFRPSAS